ncbi:MAG: NfeD family protein [Lachnospiraceae bacterium]|nr:NfeD family protein [Lachnospiraceae bacterium]
MLQYVWLAIFILLIIAECATVGLVSIWFAGGALVAMFLAMAGVPSGWQIVAFLIVSLLLLIFTRPFAMKHFNKKKTKTNYQSVIGTVVRITERVDNFNQTGAAMTDGKEWTARSAEDNVILEKDDAAVVVAVEGVKLMVKPVE